MNQSRYTPTDIDYKRENDGISGTPVHRTEEVLQKNCHPAAEEDLQALPAEAANSSVEVVSFREVVAAVEGFHPVASWVEVDLHGEEDTAPEEAPSAAGSFLRRQVVPGESVSEAALPEEEE